MILVSSTRSHIHSQDDGQHSHPSDPLEILGFTLHKIRPSRLYVLTPGSFQHLFERLVTSVGAFKGVYMARVVHEGRDVGGLVPGGCTTSDRRSWNSLAKTEQTGGVNGGKVTHVPSMTSPSPSSQSCIKTLAGKQLALSCSMIPPLA